MSHEVIETLQRQVQELNQQVIEFQEERTSMQNLLCLVVRKFGNTIITTKEIEEMPKEGHLITSYDKASGSLTIMFEEETSADSETGT